MNKFLWLIKNYKKITAGSQMGTLPLMTGQLLKYVENSCMLRAADIRISLRFLWRGSKSLRATNRKSLNRSRSWISSCNVTKTQDKTLILRTSTYFDRLTRWKELYLTYT